MRHLTTSILVLAAGMLPDLACGGGAGAAKDGSGSATERTGTGGELGTGGRASSGEKAGGGGGVGSGGVLGTGGGIGSGGRTGSGGRLGTGGGSALDPDGAASTCKRGIAANTPPGSAFFPAVGWWYNWAIQSSGGQTGIEFVPMIWGSSSLKAALPSGARFLLTFNEPNFKSQANLSAAQAASSWPAVESKAAGLPIVGPGMNFCGPADQCNGTDPYQYLKDFFAACAGCQVDYVAVHWYNCDLPSLKEYLDGGKNLAGFVQFGKPIWLTEFSCDGKASVAEQEAYMRAAIPYLEGNANVFRYSWFSADPIPNAKLVNADGSPTALGHVYIDLPGACR